MSLPRANASSYPRLPRPTDLQADMKVSTLILLQFY